VDLRAALRRLAQPVREQRVVLAQEGADHQHAVELFQLGDRHSQPRNALAPAVAREIRVPQPEIRRIAELSCQVQLFEGGMRRSKNSQRGVLYF